MYARSCILVQVTIYRRLLIDRDGHLDQSEAYDISKIVREYGPRHVDMVKTYIKYGKFTRLAWPIRMNM